jgi:hypothetical protein
MNFSEIRPAIVRFVSIMGTWAMFFWLYSKTGSDDYRFVPVVIFILGIYVFLEIVTTVLSFFVEVEEEEVDTCDLDTTLKKLYETIERKKNSHNNANADQKSDTAKC